MFTKSRQKTEQQEIKFRIPSIISCIIFISGFVVFYLYSDLAKYEFRQSVRAEYVRDLQVKVNDLAKLNKGWQSTKSEDTAKKILDLLRLDKRVLFIAFYNKAHKILEASERKYNKTALNKVAPADLAVLFDTHARLNEMDKGRYILEAVIHSAELEYDYKIYGLYVRVDLTRPIRRQAGQQDAHFLFGVIVLFLISSVVFFLLRMFYVLPLQAIFTSKEKQSSRSFFEIKELLNYLTATSKEDRELLQKKIDSESRLRRLVLKLEQEIAKRNIRLTGIQGKYKKEVEQRWKLEEQSRKMARILEYSPTSIVITNLSGEIEYVNPRFTEVTGYTFEEAMGQNPRILKSGEMPAEGYKELWDTISNGEVWRGLFHNKKKNGDFYWEYAHIAPVKNDKGEVTHYIAIKEDITRQKEAEESNIMFVKALQSIREMVTITDINNRFIYVNDSFLKTYGYSREEIIGADAQILINDDNPAKKLDEVVKQTLASGWSGELQNKTKTGSTFPVYLATSVIHNELGKPFALVGISRDLSLEKKALEIDKQSEMLHTVQELAASVSHEFSQPLQALDNYIGLMKMGQREEKYLNKIEESVKRIAALVKNLNEITGLQKRDYLDTQILDLKASSEVHPDEKAAILVVDDEEAIKETLTEMISLAGYQCDGANDGMEALRMASKNKYQLVISDVNMPRMSGTVLFDKLKSIGYSGVFIFMTGYDMSKDTEKVIQKGDGLLHKPVKSQTLMKIINSVFFREK